MGIRRRRRLAKFPTVPEGYDGPVRMCIGCGGRFPKQDLLRFVVDENGNLVWDEKQKLPGRGAYLCLRKKCFTLAEKKNALKRAYKKRPVRANLAELWQLVEEKKLKKKNL